MKLKHISHKKYVGFKSIRLGHIVHSDLATE